MNCFIDYRCNCLLLIIMTISCNCFANLVHHVPQLTVFIYHTNINLYTVQHEFNSNLRQLRNIQMGCCLIYKMLRDLMDLVQYNLLNIQQNLIQMFFVTYLRNTVTFKTDIFGCTYYDILILTVYSLILLLYLIDYLIFYKYFHYYNQPDRNAIHNLENNQK